MRSIVMFTMLSVFLCLSGCVSLSKYNERVSEVETLKKDKASSEAVGKSLDAELQQFKQNLAKLRQQHEDIKSQSMATSTEPAIADSKQTFANDLEWLAAKLAESDARIKALTVSQESLRGREAKVEELQREVAELSRKRAVSDEKEKAVAAVRAALKDELDRGEVQLKEYRDKMILSLPEQVVFDSGSATISKKGEIVLNRMAQILKKINSNQIRVEGHTDSAPIGPKIAAKFPTNWDLAAARATSVVKHLQKKGKLDVKLLSMAGYGSNLPTAANDSEKGRKQNRRIGIALVPLENEESLTTGI